MFGHCISSTVTWGANPPAAHRAEIAERWVQFATRFMGDRNAAKNGATILAPEARELAKTAPSSRQFYGGLNRLVNLLRDNHTSFGSPSNFTSFAPQVQQGSSSVMGACFGVVEKDIMDGGLGFAVFRAAADPTTGTPLKTGDVLVQIDGKDPKAWVDEVWPRFATTLPNDPRADWGSVAGDSLEPHHHAREHRHARAVRVGLLLRAGGTANGHDRHRSRRVRGAHVADERIVGRALRVLPTFQQLGRRREPRRLRRGRGAHGERRERRDPCAVRRLRRAGRLAELDDERLLERRSDASSWTRAWGTAATTRPSSTSSTCSAARTSRWGSSPSAAAPTT